MTSRRPEVSISYRFCPLCGDSLDEAPPDLLPREETQRCRLGCPQGHLWDAARDPWRGHRTDALLCVPLDRCSLCNRTLPRDVLTLRGERLVCPPCYPAWERLIEREMQEWQPDPTRSQAEIIVREGRFPDGAPCYAVSAWLSLEPPPPDPRLPRGWAALQEAGSEEELAAILAALRERMRLATDRGVPVRERRSTAPAQLALERSPKERPGAAPSSCGSRPIQLAFEESTQQPHDP
jgi:hypothetical protein